jgi:hypothetical protein
VKGSVRAPAAKSKVSWATYVSRAASWKDVWMEIAPNARVEVQSGTAASRAEKLSTSIGGQKRGTAQCVNKKVTGAPFAPIVRTRAYCTIESQQGEPAIK